VRISATRIILVLALASALLSCAHGNLHNPISPPPPTNLITLDSSPAPNRLLWGLWSIEISADRSSVTVAPNRTADLHLNTVRMLETNPCKTCLTVGKIHLITPTQFNVDVTLRHPFPGLLKYTGFDVRGIFISKADYAFPPSGRMLAWGNSVPRLMNYDGYTSLFNPTEYPDTLPVPPALKYIPGNKATGGDLSSTLNPFIAYRKDAPRRMFEAGGEETRTFSIKAPSGPIHFGYAVDACWYPVGTVVDPLVDFPLSANCLEAYAISVDAGAGLLPEDGGQTGVEVKVFDHQSLDTISAVSIYSPEIFNGAVSLNLAPNTGEPYSRFTGTIANELSAPIGFYPLLVRVTDKDADPNLGQIDAWQVYRLEIRPRKGWARTWGGSDYDQGFSVAVDGSGNAYVTGQFYGTLDFDPGAGADNHTSNGYADVYLSKFDSNGKFLWARAWGGLYDDLGISVAIDGSGNVYVTGFFGGTVDFDPGAVVDNHTSNGGNDVFLSIFDPNVNFIWARTWGGPVAGVPADCGNSVAIDGSGNAYVAGAFAGTVDFDPGAGVDNHTSNGDDDIFLSKFDPNGNLVSARTWGGPGEDMGCSAAIDGSGNVYVTGFFEDTVDFDPGAGVDSHASNGGSDVFLNKLDPSGNFVWARTWGGLGYEEGVSVAVDGSGNAYITGWFADTVDFDPGAGVDNHASNGLYDVFLSKLDANGNFVWARTWGGSDLDYGNSVAIDGSGNAYITGRFSNTVDFDPGAGVDKHALNGLYDIFLNKLDANGNFVWARTWGGFDYDEGYSVMIDGSGNAYITGEFTGTVDFDPGLGADNHVSNGSGNAFLSKFPPDGNW
jgi:hypothetical protein